MELNKMALSTVSTAGISGIAFTSSISATDFANMQQHIMDDLINSAPNHPILADAFTRIGQLFVPNRGVLQIRPGDVIAYDSAGWPILISADSIAYGSSSWTVV
jgi:hypothetical protein